MRLSTKQTVHHGAQSKGRDGLNFLAQPWMKKASDTQRGYTYQRKNGLITSNGITNTAETAPLQQLEKIVAAGGVDPSNYFKQAKQLGMNPAEAALGMSKSGPSMP